METTKTESSLPPASDNTQPGQPLAPEIDSAPQSLPIDKAISPRWQRLRLAAVAALVIGYAALSHYSTTSPNSKGLGAALSVAPIALVGVILAWRWTRPLMALLIAGSLCALLFRYWAVVERTYEWADLAQQCGAYGLVALTFARSLCAGQVPLCTLLANQVHGSLTPAEIAYTRRATAAWVVFYVLLAIAILVLFFVVPLRVWSLFVNFAVFGLMMLMGLADHSIRQRILPRHTDGGILAIIRRSLIG
jgi:uncharacterized membrane protein